VTSNFLAAFLLSVCWAMPLLALGQSFTCPALRLEREQTGHPVSPMEPLEDIRRGGGIVNFPRFTANVMDQPFFKGLEQVRTADGIEFRKNGHAVQSYPDSFVMTMRPIAGCQPDCIKSAVIPGRAIITLPLTDVLELSAQVLSHRSEPSRLEVQVPQLRWTMRSNFPLVTC